MHWIKKIKTTFATALFAFMLSCALSSPKSEDYKPLQVPESYGKRALQQITDSGQNWRPQVSKDGKTLLYTSSEKSTHKYSQAYQRDLTTGAEKRLTYQYGDVYEIHFSNNENKFVYSSSTDELKEDPPYIEKHLRKIKGHKEKDITQRDDLDQKLPQTEIYRSSTDGNNIKRITSNPSFDGDISVRGKRHEVAYVRWTEKVPQSYIINMKTNNKSTIGDGKSWSSDPAFSRDGEELAWVEKTKDNEWLLLTGDAYGKDGKIRYQSKSRIRDLAWHPDGSKIFFSEDLSGNYEIFIFEIDSACKKRLTFHSALDLHPYASPKNDIVYFNSDRSDSFQIYSLSLTALPPCAESQ